MKKVKNCSSYQTREHLVKTFIHWIIILKGAPKYQNKSYRSMCRVCENHIMTLGWSSRWFCVAERVDFIMELFDNWQNKMNLPQNLQLKIKKGKLTSHENSIMLLQEDKHIKPVYLEEACKWSSKRDTGRNSLNILYNVENENKELSFDKALSCSQKFVSKMLTCSHLDRKKK